MSEEIECVLNLEFYVFLLIDVVNNYWIVGKFKLFICLFIIDFIIIYLIKYLFNELI